MGDAFAQFIGHPLVQGTLLGLLAAASTDYDAFKGWKSYRDAMVYDWGLAVWRWFKGALIGFVGALGSMGLIRAMGSVLLATVLIGSVGCGGKVPPITAVPAAVNAADQNVHAASIKVLGIIEGAGHVADRASQIEQALYVDGVVPDALHQSISAAFRGLATDALKAIDAIEAGTTDTWPALKAQVDPLLARVQALIDTVQQLGDKAGAFRTWVDALKEVVIETLGHLMLQGAAFGGAQ